jgi:hypothetical protein
MTRRASQCHAKSASAALEAWSITFASVSLDEVFARVSGHAGFNEDGILNHSERASGHWNKIET